jgi:hypothetical protein
MAVVSIEGDGEGLNSRGHAAICSLSIPDQKIPVQR